MAFPTEQEIYHRLRWDPRFDIRRASIVISTRPAGTKRIPYVEYDTSLIPWHRIVEFWIDDQLAWSRPQRIDRLDAIATGKPVVPPAPAHAHVAVAPVGVAVPPAPRPLRVVTWNLLFDRYEAERLRSPERWTDALARLGALDADIVVLQEITVPLWDRIVGAFPQHVATCSPLDSYGQVILSRYPLRSASSIALSRDKHALFAVLEIGDQSVGVAALHLTSNRKPDAAAIRATQLASVLDAIAQLAADAWIIAGDFNAPPAELPIAGTIDVWRDAATGMTFDPSRNPLAAQQSRTGRSARYDRIHVRNLRPVSATLVGETPGPCGLHPSDHFGVFAELTLVGARQALVVMPPVELWGPLQRIRCRDDRNWAKWPPHVTLFHPFVELGGDLEAVIAAHLPFDLALDRITTLDARGQLVVLEPSRAHALTQLRAALASELRIADEARAYRPHLTLGRVGRKPAGLAASWRVDRLVVLESAGKGEPYRPVGDMSSAAIAPHAATLLTALRHRLPAARIELFGSSVYAPQAADDVDLLVDAATPADFPGLRDAGGRLRGVIAGQRVDITISTDERVRAAVADAHWLRHHLEAHGRAHVFDRAWPEVKRWARARALLHNGLGYFSSVGWALLLADPLCHDEALCAVGPDEAFAAWLGWAAAHPPSELPTPTPPARNVMRYVTPGTRRTLFAELRRGCLDDLADAPPPGVTLEAYFATDEERGAYEGRALELIRRLETEVGGIRVWGRFDRDGDGWVHRYTVDESRAERARALIGNYACADDTLDK